MVKYSQLGAGFRCVDVENKYENNNALMIDFKANELMF